MESKIKDDMSPSWYILLEHPQKKTNCLSITVIIIAWPQLPWTILSFDQRHIWHCSTLVTAHGIILVPKGIGLTRTEYPSGAHIHGVSDGHAFIKAEGPRKNRSIGYVIIPCFDCLTNLTESYKISWRNEIGESQLSCDFATAFLAHLLLEFERTSIDLVIGVFCWKIILVPSRTSQHLKPNANVA